MLEPIEIALTQKMAMIFEIAGKQQNNPYVFTMEFISSKTYDDLFTFLPGEIEQSPLCEYKMFLKEMDEKHIQIPSLDKKIEYDFMFWLGYLLTYWGYLKKIHPEKIIKRYDIEKMIGAYETLHTLKTEAAIDFIMHEYCKSSDDLQ